MKKSIAVLTDSDIIADLRIERALVINKLKRSILSDMEISRLIRRLEDLDTALKTALGKQAVH